MLTIFTDQIQKIKAVIDAEYRLNEIVDIKNIAEITEDLFSNYIIVRNNDICLGIRWSNETPPYLFPNTIPFTPENLLSIVYTQLNNFEEAYQKSKSNEKLLTEIDTLNCIQHAVPTTIKQQPEQFDSRFEEYRFWHNAAIMGQYAELTHFVHYNTTKNYYEKGYELAPNDEYKAFTGKHLATLLLDGDELEFAENVLENCIEFAISDEAKIELKNILYAVWMKQLTAPYDNNLLLKIKNTLWEVLQHYEKTQNHIQVALLLIDASQVANVSDSFSESLGYISRAIQLLEDEDVPELVANALYRKGTLLYTWATNGNPQFFRPALETYQKALKIFTKENAPEVFAEIHHHLGVIYSEIPDEVKTKSIWASVSVSSFKEALSYFTLETNPYEYARICNSYANALTKYPEAKLADNYLKALDFYRQALIVRNASDYPYERTLTILNFLETAWFVSVPELDNQQKLYNEMTQLANEIHGLVNDVKLTNEAQSHLDKLKELKKVLV